MFNCTGHSTFDSMSRPTAGSRVHIFNFTQRSKETARIDHGIKGSQHWRAPQWKVVSDMRIKFHMNAIKIGWRTASRLSQRNAGIDTGPRVVYFPSYRIRMREKIKKK